ncbi:universal stress protein [Mycobacterium sp.]|uniref:universal stress protein n=1 Tax=Mycobacterium sp. TaxID=1785 RepID=UPI003F98EB2E
MNKPSTPESIVVGIDGSKAAVCAALWAIDEAVSRDIPLRLLYAIEPDDAASVRPELAARRLAIAENAIRYAFMAAEAAGEPVKIEVEITQERAITSLIRASASAAMLCIGAVGAHHFQPGRVGSTAAVLALSARCPVAIIRGQGDRAARRTRWVVVDAEGSADSGALLGIAVEEARLCNSPLRAITCRQTGVRDIGSATEDDDRRILANLDRRLARWTRRYPDVRVECSAVHGGVLDYLAENGQSVQLLVVSARDRENLGQVVGPTGNAVLHNADCSLLVVDHQYL